MTTRPCSLAIAALVVALAAAAARPAAAGLPQYTEMFATLTMVDGTMKQRPGASCPFTAAKDGSLAEAACGEGRRLRNHRRLGPACLPCLQPQHSAHSCLSTLTGKAFTVHWSNETTNDDGLWEVELLQGGSPSGSSLSALYCAEGVGTGEQGRARHPFPTFTLRHIKYDGMALLRVRRQPCPALAPPLVL